MKVKVDDHTQQVKAELAHRMPIVLEALGIEAEGNAVTEINKLVYDTPPSDSYTRTGRLKNSITHTHDDEAAFIGTNVEYAPYVEFGTRSKGPRPFLRNAVTNYTDDYVRIVEAGLST